MAMAKQGSEALAKVDANDELAVMLDEQELATDGLEEIDGSDIKIASKVFNMKGVDAAGDPIPPNVFYDTIDETTTKELRLVILSLHKTREWSAYDEAQEKNVRHCWSPDRKEGRLQSGERRSCSGCPDAQWRSVDGKRNRNCGDVFNLVSIDLETQTPCVLRCKRTSLKPIELYLNKYFIGRRPLKAGGRGNYPLFAFESHVALEMVGGKYSVPIFRRGPVRSAEQIRASAEESTFYREVVMPELERLSAQDVGEGSAVGLDTSFNPSDFVDEAPAAELGLR